MYMLMDINKIFDLFNQTEFDAPLAKKAKAVDELLNFKETPVFWVGMFKKLILNNQNFYKQLLHFLPSEVVNEILSLDDASEKVVFARAWYYISKIDLSHEVDRDALKVFGDKELVICFKMAISYYEEKEEYKRCAHLKKIQDYVEENLT